MILAVTLFLITTASAATGPDPACEARLLPPATIKQFAVNFLARTADRLDASEGLDEAAELTRELIEKAGDGEFEVKMVEGLRGNFDLKIGYPAGLDGIQPRMRTLEISPRAANALFRAAKPPAGKRAPPEEIDYRLLTDWVSALSEVFPEHEYQKGRIPFEEVNLFTVLEAKVRWRDAVARMGDGDPLEPLTEREAAELMWPAIRAAAEAHDFRKIIAWLGVGHFNRVGGDAKALAESIQAPPKPYHLNRFKEIFLAMGKCAANLFAASQFVEEPGIAEAFDLTPQKAKELMAQAGHQWDDVMRVAKNALSLP